MSDRSTTAGEDAIRIAQATFPRVERPAKEDFASITRQIGRKPSGEILIASRCPLGKPEVILTLPGISEGGSTPPLLWLCCPELCRMVGSLESEGAIRRYRDRLERDKALNEGFLSEEEVVAAACSEFMRALGGDTLWRKLGGRGASGGRPGSVKCLHAHLALTLATGWGTLGCWCLEEVSDDEWSGCERPRDACVD